MQKEFTGDLSLFLHFCISLTYFFCFYYIKKSFEALHSDLKILNNNINKLNELIDKANKENESI